MRQDGGTGNPWIENKERTDAWIARLIEAHPGENLDPLISDRENPRIHWHLSSLRGALLAWYPFPEHASVLEIGSGFGGLTGELLRRADHVDALEKNRIRAEAIAKRYRDAGTLNVICASAPEAPEEELTGAPYDCVVIVRLLEKHPDEAERILRFARDHLKKDGTLLLGCMNRFGLRYLCGATDDIVMEPFGSLRPRMAGEAGAYTRSELKKMLGGAGFGSVRFAYPMPNMLFTQAVYTDEHLPDDTVGERVFPFDPWNSPLIASERGLYPDLVRERSLPFIANDYLCICREETEASLSNQFRYAVLSCDRGDKNGFMTVLHDDFVEKRVWRPEGVLSLKTMHENSEALRARGLKVVPQTWDGDAVRMPLITDPPLMEVLRREARRGGTETIRLLLEQLRSDILRSSDRIELSEEEARRMWGCSAEALGPVLAEARIDMIPFNAFLRDGSFVYYDQEFTRGNCPAGYVLYRALNYTWMHIPEMEKCIPQREMAREWGLDAGWDAFAKTEYSFVRDNRRFDTFKVFYKWARFDAKAAEERRKGLAEGAAKNR